MRESRNLSKAQKLLLEYRSLIWRKAALESVPGIKPGVLDACMEQIRFTEALVDTLHGNPLGEKLYHIIHATYMTEKQPGDVNEILLELTQSHEHIPRSTYFRLRGCAIDLLDKQLDSMAYPQNAS